MSSEKVVAISADIMEIGKRVSDSKKKFIWRFKIVDTSYTIALVSSALSGKRIVTLNDEQIYTEKNVLNMNFDFIHNVQGHSIRIYKEADSVNVYGCRIDNRSFDYLLRKATSVSDVKPEKKQSKFAASNNDPFSQFSSFAAKKPVQTKNQFGDFDDFGGFEFSKPQKTESPTLKTSAKPKPKNEDFFDFGSEKVQAQNFETNNFSKFQNNMKEVDLLGSENEFATNTYGQYNNYLDLINSEQGGASDTWGTEDPNKEKTMMQKIRPDISGKQARNRAMMTAVEIKKKAVDLLDM